MSAPIDWDVIAPPPPVLTEAAKRELERQAAEPLDAYLRRLYQEQN